MTFDQDTERLMTTVEIDDDSLAEKWFQAICDTYKENAEDWSAFRHAFAANALQADSSFDDAFTEPFFRAAEEDLTNPLDALNEMSTHSLDELVRTYPDLLEQKRTALASQASESHDASTLWWVTDDQRARLEGALGAAWQSAVVDTLDDKWPPWRGGTQDGLVGFVNDWMAEILARAPQASEAAPGAEEPQDPATLWWVTDDQRAQLEGALGAAWQSAVVDTLDDKWPPWRGATPDGLVGFVGDWMGTILARAPQPTASEEQGAERTQPGAADRLYWVSGEQQRLLESEIYPDGHWQEQLGAQLDIRWGEGWEGQPADTKREMLENIIGTLALTPTEDLSEEELEKVSELAESLIEGGLEKLEELLDSDDQEELGELLEAGVLEEEFDEAADEEFSL